MYRCQLCNELVPPGISQHKLIVKTRERVYHSARGETKRFEIVKELSVCPTCHELHRDSQAERK